MYLYRMTVTGVGVKPLQFYDQARNQAEATAKARVQAEYWAKMFHLSVDWPNTNIEVEVVAVPAN